MLLSSFDRRFIGGERALLLTTLGVDYIVSVQTSYNAQQATLSPDPKVLPLATDGAIGELSWGGSTTATNFR